jgi:hypothetical protein
MNTPHGPYRPRFLPEGVSVGSGLMMGDAYKIFGEYTEWLIPIHDNILIAAHSSEEMLEKIKIVLKRCAEVGVQLNFKKCQFGVTSLKFFGYIVEPGQYFIKKDRILDILEVPFPKTKKQLQKYLGMAVFCSPFIPNFVSEFATLYDTIKDSFSFEPTTWGEMDYHEEFKKSKKHLLKATAVHFPDRNLEWVLRTDASQIAIGGVLLQMVPMSQLTEEQQRTAREMNLIRDTAVVHYRGWCPSVSVYP